ncbi:hypothetical protein GUITHDRAFT_154339 [Guillardia theta CCMP2712]|uniref:Uncharacterized protein n=1 Tax=Guillardia theta (strain CCMP2712) TaxID=905079 RepID=L1ITV6_GUITC|nr:hypothetical protein GUITHDRAFT_154339 [Guillardia theta CCMP2712]EKX39673.1 hypothetical protein GUITHDRAFT_154339 [Guillardia theta CCMP2712]|eukprot:XP_005826653.1 hypothetical protein GUITHDRAFT_154339 [Guillardia theta CCMP2712]
MFTCYITSSASSCYEAPLQRPPLSANFAAALGNVLVGRQALRKRLPPAAGLTIVGGGHLLRGAAPSRCRQLVILRSQDPPLGTRPSRRASAQHVLPVRIFQTLEQANPVLYRCSTVFSFKGINLECVPKESC